MQRHGRRCAAINLPKWEITGASVGRGRWGVGMGGCEGLGLKKKRKKTYGQQRFKKKPDKIFLCRILLWSHRLWTSESSKSAHRAAGPAGLRCCEGPLLTGAPPLDICTAKLNQLAHIKTKTSKKTPVFTLSSVLLLNQRAHLQLLVFSYFC